MKVELNDFAYNRIAIPYGGFWTVYLDGDEVTVLNLRIIAIPYGGFWTEKGTCISAYSKWWRLQSLTVDSGLK